MDSDLIHFSLFEIILLTLLAYHEQPANTVFQTPSFSLKVDLQKYLHFQQKRNASTIMTRIITTLYYPQDFLKVGK